MQRTRMKRRLIPVLALVTAMGIAACASTPEKPVLTQATFIESLGPDGTKVKATGQGKDAGQALIDARRSALAYVKDQIITTPEGRAIFESYEKQFYSNPNLFITQEDPRFISRVKTPDGQVRIEKIIVVNPMKVEQWLVDNGVIQARGQVTEAIGNPIIMVLPEKQAMGQPWAGHAATAIQRHLTAKRYEVKVPEAAQEMQGLTENLRDLKGHLDDAATLIAMKVGADVYIKFNVDIAARQAGSTSVGKASATVNAFETTTARALGSATGFSRERPLTDRNILIEEAVVDGIDKVLNNVDAFWKDDAARGIQYRIIVAGDSATTDGRLARNAVMQSLREIAKTTKPLMTTEKTLDFQIWGGQKDYFAVMSDLQAAFAKYYRGSSPAELIDEQMFSKMLMFRIE